MKRLIVFLVLGGTVTAGVAYGLFGSRTVHLSEDSFTYTPVEFGTLRDTVSATGTLRPRDVVAVGSEQAGKVIKVFVDVNDVVEEGDALLQLDDEMAQLRLKQARQNVQAAQAAIAHAQALQEAAQRGLDLQLELQKSGSGFRTEAERYRSQVKAAQAAVTAAEVKKIEAQTAMKLAQLGKDLMTVRMPAVHETSARPADPVGLRGHPVSTLFSSGSKLRYRVLQRKVVLGQMVAPGATTPLFTLATDLTDMQVHAQVAESDIARVKAGLRAAFTVSAYSESDQEFKGQVVQRRLMPTSVQGAVYYDTVIDVVNTLDPQTNDWRLLPGMTAAVDIIIHEHRRVWKVPTTALSFQMDEHHQSEAAQAKLARWQERLDRDDWKPLWVWDAQRDAPWPIFVRVGGLKNGAPGIKDSQFNEILEWEPGQEPGSQRAAPRVIIGAPPYRKPGLFDQPTNLKIS